MSKQTYSIPGISGEFELVLDSDSSCCCEKCAMPTLGRYRCCIACGPDKHLELIPGTDAPAKLATPELALIVARDRVRVLEEETAAWFSQGKSASARIVDLEAKLSAMESAKPLAVLPPLTGDEPVKAICADIGRIDHDPISDDEMDIAVWGVEIGYALALALSRIQPVNPEYLAALEGLEAFVRQENSSQTWAIGVARCLEELGDIRARLAAGKGGA